VKIRKKDSFFYFLVLFLFSLSLLLGFYNLSGWLINDDEGLYLYSAWRVSLGEITYRDFFVSQTPLSFYFTGFLFKIFSPDVGWARGICYLLFLVIAFFIYLISKEILKLNKYFSLLNAAVFIFTKNINFLGKTFMPDCFMLFWGTIALYFVLKAEDKSSSERRALYLFLFGFFGGLAALSKLFGILLFLGYYLFLLYSFISKQDKQKKILLRALHPLVGFLLSFGIIYVFMLIFIPSTYYCTLGFHLGREKTVLGLSLVLNSLVNLLKFIGNHNYGVVPVALVSIISGFIFKKKEKILLFFLILPFFFLTFIPVDFLIRYLFFTLIAFSLFFGDSLRLIHSKKRIFSLSFPVIFIILILSLAPTFNIKKILRYDRGTRDLVNYINKHSMPDDYIFSDFTGINFYSKRPCPPLLVDVSGAMTTSGQITALDIERQCELYKVKIIFVHKRGAAHHLINLKDYSEFQKYLDEKYTFQGTIKREFQEYEIYFRKSS